MKPLRLLHYDSTGHKMLRVSEHKSQKALLEAIRRARKKNEIVAREGVRTVDDPPMGHS